MMLFLEELWWIALAASKFSGITSSSSCGMWMAKKYFPVIELWLEELM
jgi:hypothetical protein